MCRWMQVRAEKPISLVVVSRMDMTTVYEGGSSKGRNWRIDYLPVVDAFGDYVRHGRLVELCLASHSETIRVMVRLMADVHHSKPIHVAPDLVPGALEACLFGLRCRRCGGGWRKRVCCAN